ncbi:hypothetical protein ACIQM4_24950 [Streptomyces sp. NPDC091272]|uniref:hypothetical protein n=1 Tax=Streptomyces sp. NPDC091272 TaxID=3365981 RepID=UPI00380C825C
MGDDGSDLSKGVGALRRFQSRVNVLLNDLEGGDAGRTKIAAQRVSRASLSGGNAAFAEADGLYAQYNRVHQQLTSLSKTLGYQIEALSIGVHASEVGYDNVEEEVRQRYAGIQARLTEEQLAQERRDLAYEREQRQREARLHQPGPQGPSTAPKTEY